MKKQRLLKLADLLEADAKNRKGIKFDLTVIATKSDEDKTKYFDGEIPPVDCGTAACAVGLACISGAFKKSGFTYRYDDCWGIIPTYTDSDGKRYSGFDQATCPFFGLSHDESDYLFQPRRYPHDKLTGAVGERYVAKRIRQFVETNGDNAKKYYYEALYA